MLLKIIYNLQIQQILSYRRRTLHGIFSYFRYCIGWLFHHPKNGSPILWVVGRCVYAMPCYWLRLLGLPNRNGKKLPQILLWNVLKKYVSAKIGYSYIYRHAKFSMRICLRISHLKIFLKIIEKKFGGLNNLPYLCCVETNETYFNNGKPAD